MRAVFILSIFLGVFGPLVQTFDIDGLKRMESRSKVVEMRMDFDNMDLDDESTEDDEDDEVMSRRIHYLGDDDDFAEEDEVLSRLDDLGSDFDGMDRFDDDGSAI